MDDIDRAVDARGARPVDEGGRLADSSPVPLARRLVVRELDAHARAPADLEVLLDGLEQPRGLVADVTRVEPALLLHDRAERRELRRVAEGARRVDETRGEAGR